MKKVLAISGGVDSMLLLREFCNDKDAVVAHFDHGTRPSAKDDAKFVEQAAKEWELPVYLGHGNLGEKVSEAVAREARYAFLKKIAKKVDGEIYTAHHTDDLVESIAINLLRGTSWRGLTPFYDKSIKRIFLDTGLSKKDIYKKAAELGIAFRQDPTNNEENYLRNRVRRKLAVADKKDAVAICELYKKQVALREEIEKIIDELLPKDGRYERIWFESLDDKVALELLRVGLQKVSVSATYPQIKEFLTAIKTFSPEKKFNLPGGKLVTIHKHNFVLR